MAPNEPRKGRAGILVLRTIALFALAGWIGTSYTLAALFDASSTPAVSRVIGLGLHATVRPQLFSGTEDVAPIGYASCASGWIFVISLGSSAILARRRTSHGD